MLKSLYRKLFELIRSPKAVCEKYGHDKNQPVGDFGHGSRWTCRRCGDDDVDGQN